MAPKPVEGKPRAKLVGVRVLPEKKQRYQRAAIRAKMSLSDWVRTLLDKAS